MATVGQNFELGAAGLFDKAAGVFGFQPDEAAKVFAKQTATDPDQVAVLQSQAVTAEDTQDVIGQATDATEQQIADDASSVVDDLKFGLGVATILGLVVVGGLVFVAVKYRAEIKKLLV